MHKSLDQIISDVLDSRDPLLDGMTVEDAQKYMTAIVNAKDAGEYEGDTDEADAREIRALEAYDSLHRFLIFGRAF